MAIVPGKSCCNVVFPSSHCSVHKKEGRVAESNFCGTPILRTNQEKNGCIASKSNQPKRKEA